MKKMITIFWILLFLVPVISSCSIKIGTAHEMCTIPSSFSWRDIDGVDYTTPIKDQAPAPTCEAFAFCAVLETKMQYQLKELYTPDLSENHLYFYAGGTMKKGYVNIIDAAHYLMTYGVPDEGCYPDPHRPFDYPFKSLAGWENRTVKITEWGWVDHNISVMKQALIDHGPLIICIGVYQDFNFYHGGVYHHRWGPRIGGHVVAIVGYNDSQQCWIVKNSWGTKWGEDGWFRMAYDADLISTWYGPGTGVMYLDGLYGNLKPDAPKVYFETPRYFHTYLFGREISTFLKKLPIQKAAARILGPLSVEVTAEDTNSVEFFIDDVSKYVDTEAPFSWNLEATQGLHTLTVRAVNDHNIASLAIEDIYVVL
jgi:hypothetical protein